MFEIIFHYLIFLTIIFSNGLLFQKIIFYNNKIELNIFEQSFLGLIVTGFISLILNFFIPLNDILIYFNLSFGIFFIYFFKDKIKLNYNIYSKIFIILIFLLSLINIYGSNFSDDLHHYHAGYITNTDNHNYILGLNFLHHHYGYSSIWLILHSYLNFNNSLLQDIHILNGLVLFLIIAYLFTENNEALKNPKNSFLILISGFILIFLLVKYTRLKEFGLDRPGTIIYCFLLYFTAKYNILIKKNINLKNQILFILFFFCLFITSIKIFFLSCFLIPIFLIIKSGAYSFVFNKFAFIFYFLCIAYFIKNIFITGCLIYPFELTCFTNLSWASNEISSNILLGVESIAKSYDRYEGSLGMEEYIKNFNWLNTWIIRNIEEFNNYILTVLLALTLFFLTSKSSKNISRFNNLEILFLLLFIFNIIIFIKSPVSRYHHMFFILLGLSFIILSKRVFIKKISFFNVALIIILFFNFGKNFQRIYKNDFYNNPYELIKTINWYTPPTKKNVGSFVYFSGWIDAHPIGNMDLSNYKHKKIFWFDIIYKN